MQYLTGIVWLQSRKLAVMIVTRRAPLESAQFGRPRGLSDHIILAEPIM